jgi:kynurenine formamidase
VEHGKGPSSCLTIARRDPRQTSHDGDPLLEYLRERELPVALTSVNYRLSPEVRHPEHQQDVIAALKYLTSAYGMKQFVLVGHSAGACLAFQSGHIPGCKGIIGVEGLYDLSELVNEYPQYRDLVEEAFGTDERVWVEASPSHIVQHLSNLDVLLVQSTEDELLSRRQTELMYSSSKKVELNVRDVAWIHGTHASAIASQEFYDVVYSFIEQLLDL